jgi:hypothetical protein
MHAVGRRFLDGHSVDAAILGAVRKKELRLPSIAATGLALGPDELVAEIEYEVVTLVDAPRHQDRVAAANELVNNGPLGPLPDIDRVIAALWFRQS